MSESTQHGLVCDVDTLKNWYGRVSRTQLQVALFALEIWTLFLRPFVSVRVRCLWRRLRGTSCSCFSCAVHYATSIFLIQSGVVRIRNEVRHGVACQTPFPDNLSLAITHLGMPWETLLNPVVRRSQQVSFRLQRSWSPQTSSRTMNGRVNKVSVGLRQRGSQLV